METDDRVEETGNKNIFLNVERRQTLRRTKDQFYSSPLYIKINATAPVLLPRSWEE